MSAETQSEVQRRERQAADLQKLLPQLIADKLRGEVLSAANKAGLEVIEKHEEGVYVGSVLFLFSGDKVSAVTLQ